jgi:hypothetical protein
MTTLGIIWVALIAVWLTQDWFRYAKVWTRTKRRLRRTFGG